MGSQEVSKPVLIVVIVLVVLVIGWMGWRFLKPQQYPGYQAPVGGPGMGGQSVPRMIPGQEPGRTYPPPGTPR